MSKKWTLIKIDDFEKGIDWEKDRRYAIGAINAISIIRDMVDNEKDFSRDDIKDILFNMYYKNKESK